MLSSKNPTRTTYALAISNGVVSLSVSPTPRVRPKYLPYSQLGGVLPSSPHRSAVSAGTRGGEQGSSDAGVDVRWGGVVFRGCLVEVCF